MKTKTFKETLFAIQKLAKEHPEHYKVIYGTTNRVAEFSRLSYARSSVRVGQTIYK